MNKTNKPHGHHNKRSNPVNKMSSLLRRQLCQKDGKKALPDVVPASPLRSKQLMNSVKKRCKQNISKHREAVNAWKLSNALSESRNQDSSSSSDDTDSEEESDSSSPDVDNNNASYQSRINGNRIYDGSSSISPKPPAKYQVCKTSCDNNMKSTRKTFYSKAELKCRPNNITYKDNRFIVVPHENDEINNNNASSKGEKDKSDDDSLHRTEVAPNGEDLNELIEVQKRLYQIAGQTDKGLLREVVAIIMEDVGETYHVGKSTFDFDLCLLDKKTVKKIQLFLETNDGLS